MMPRPHFIPHSVFCWLLVACAVVTSTTLAEDGGTIHETPVTADDRDHWAFQELVRPQVPAVNNADWPRSAVDCFILSELEDEELTPSHEADRTTLIRRLHFDLIGLPPTPAEVRRFVNDTDPAAYEHLVDRLLASPHYGERWAQHWLDLARFAETDGFEHDKIRPHAWKYRDWVIDALNTNLPYDEFVRLQIAGDVIAGDDPAAVVATGFCLAGPDMPDINSQEQRKHILLNEMTATVGSVFLGLQMGCAQCHDHKYDPVSQADFYRLRAFFKPAVQVKKNQSVETLVSSPSDSVVSHILLRGDWQRLGPEVEAAFPRIADPWEHPLSGADADQQRAELAFWMTRPDHPLTARVMVNRIWQYHFGRGLAGTPSDFGLLGESPSHPELLDWLAAEFVASAWDMKSLHRLLVTSAVYRQASHPEEDATSVSRWQAAREADPSNELLWCFPRQRLDAEIVRDAMLSACGSLDAERGGPGVRPPLPPELVATLLKDQWKPSKDEADHHRRSIYIFARRNLRYPLFEVFDRPAANDSCPQRGQTTTARQSLLMLNSELVLDMAQQLAARVLDDGNKTYEAQAIAVFQFALSREPQAEELAALVEFLEKQQSLLAADGRVAEELSLPRNTATIENPYAAAALTDLCLAVLNSSEFVYVD